MDIVAYTDGGCRGNPGVGAWAFALVDRATNGRSSALTPLAKPPTVHPGIRDQPPPLSLLEPNANVFQRGADAKGERLAVVVLQRGLPQAAHAKSWLRCDSVGPSPAGGGMRRF